ncbi:MAG: hypothetical protein HY237_05815 [Acidobacteria bacterium]|nr:hypothetical protein [Acidobacteriota bacterium]
MSTKLSQQRNEYRCSIEVNQNGKYCVRIRASFARHSWVLSVYFLASSFDRAMKKLEQSLQFLQRQEDRLWFWGVDRSDDPNLSGEMLREAGLRLDRRAEFPRKSASMSLPPERPVPAFALAPVRRGLAESIEGARAAAAAGD